MANPFFSEYNRERVVGVRPWLEGDIISDRDTEANSSAIVYTVPAQTVFLLFAWSLNLIATAAVSERSYANLRNTIPETRYQLGLLYRATVGSEHASGSFFVPLEMSSGETIRHGHSGTDGESHFSFYGIECARDTTEY